MDGERINIRWVAIGIVAILIFAIWPTYRAVPIGLTPQTFQVGDFEVLVDIESSGDNGPYRMPILVDDQRVGQFSGTFNLDFWQEDYPGYYRYAWIDRDLKLDLVIEPSHDEPHFVGSTTGKLERVRR